MKRDPNWVKSRIAARILLRRHQGALTLRDRKWAHSLRNDPGVTDRLVDQAIASICAEKNLSYESVSSQSTLGS